MTKPYQYWLGQWENSTKKDAEKALDLLCAYAGSNKGLLAYGMKGKLNGGVGRLFSGRRTHHGTEVETAIASFFHMSGLYAHETKFQTVEFILATVKNEIGQAAPINPNGDLATILQVIKDKTNVDYFQLDAKTICKDYKSSILNNHHYI